MSVVGLDVGRLASWDATLLWFGKEGDNETGVVEGDDAEAFVGIVDGLAVGIRSALEVAIGLKDGLVVDTVGPFGGKPGGQQQLR
mmetsp:Transcript_22785/g.27869  ORF Transcript_22785/g.27869 Transcript_22785/m.27869 type:complete len:85 (-) Transcript_22785:504-758(-)